MRFRVTCYLFIARDSVHLVGHSGGVQLAGEPSVVRGGHVRVHHRQRLHVLVAGEATVELRTGQLEYAVQVVGRFLIAVFDLAEHLEQESIRRARQEDVYAVLIYFDSIT